MPPTGILRPQGSRPLPAPADPMAATRARATLAAGVLEARVYLEVTVPRTDRRARMRLLSRVEAKQVRHETRLAMAELGLGDAAKSPSPEVYREWHDDIVTRTLAVAVRATDSETPLAPLEEWELCDDDQLDTLWIQYQDLERRLDPLSRPLTRDEQNAIAAAAKKKELATLISYGSSALANYVISTASPPES